MRLLFRARWLLSVFAASFLFLSFSPSLLSSFDSRDQSDVSFVSQLSKRNRTAPFLFSFLSFSFFLCFFSVLCLSLSLSLFLTLILTLPLTLTLFLSHSTWALCFYSLRSIQLVDINLNRLKTKETFSLQVHLFLWAHTYFPEHHRTCTQWRGDSTIRVDFGWVKEKGKKSKWTELKERKRERSGILCCCIRFCIVLSSIDI